MNLTQKYNELLKFASDTNNHPGKTITDKGLLHSYIEEYYNKKFTPLKNAPIRILEIGISHGYSMDLWLSFFEEAMLFGIDNDGGNLNSINRLSEFKNFKGIFANGYDNNALSLFKDNEFDFIIDDGPHTLDSQIFSAKNWIYKVKKEGFLIIEDLQNPDFDIPKIKKQIENIKVKIEIFDLRSKKNRYDDVILEIQKLF